MSQTRRVTVFGLGYVGTVTAAALARDGHEVVGVDVSPEKLETLRAGRSPVLEPGVDEIVAAAAAHLPTEAASVGLRIPAR